MLLQHLGREPQVDPEAMVAPDATLCGDVRLARGVRVMHGARLIAEGGKIRIGENSIVMPNAVVRSTAAHDCRLGRSVLVGPLAHVVGAEVGDAVFLATGTAIFHGSRIGRASVVRIHGVVHVNSTLAPRTTVPIGWIAAGDPAELFSPDRHDDLWAMQEPLKFTLTAYGIDAPLMDSMEEVTARLSERLATHGADGPA